VPHTTLVSPELLQHHLADWAIVDCRFDLQRPDWGFDQYRAAHVPSAVYANLSSDLAAPSTGTNGRHPMPDIESLADTMSRLGMAPGVQVVAYDQDAGMYASRLWWTLRYLGHDEVAVLDGGWARWQAEGRPMRSGTESRRRAHFEPAPRPHLLAQVEEVASHVASGGRLVDARAPERFEGRSEPIDRVPGHIPGAVNHFFKQNLAADGTMLPADALRAGFARTLGGVPPGRTIVYCGSGVTACHDLLAMEHAGLSGARLYVGSWSEWSADPKRPVGSGSQP
jgi:thiosulfate/3-mercaptopyruvate sulfurtransferase